MDFQFYLNRQGVRGAKGVKGDKGDSPIVSVNKHTANEYVLQIDNPDGTQIITPNLVGQQIVVNAAGDYVKYDRASGQFVTVELPSSTSEKEGLIRIATNADYEERDELSAVTPYGLVQNLPSLISVSTDNLIRIFYDEPTDSMVFDTSNIDADIKATNAIATEALTASQNNTNEINVLKSTISGISGDYVTLDTAQTISSPKTFADTVTFNSIVNFGTSAYIFSDSSGLNICGHKELNIHWGEAPNSSVARFNNNGCAWYTEQFDVQGKLTVKGSPAIVQQNLIEGDNIKLVKDPVTGNVTISSTAPAGSIIDDSTTADDKVWSSSKTNSEISTVVNELVQTQGDVASLDADIAEITPIVQAHTESISNINDSIGQLNNKIANILERLTTLEATVASLQTQIGDISVKLDEINGEEI